MEVQSIIQLYCTVCIIWCVVGICSAEEMTELANSRDNIKIKTDYFSFA